MNTLQRCTECGGVFQFLPRGVCGTCLEEIEKDYDTVREFVRDNPRATMHDLAAATGVDDERIRTFIAEGRLQFQPSQADLAAASHCEMCGAPLFEGRHCEACRAKIVHGLSDSVTVDRPAPGRPVSAPPSSAKVHRGMHGRRG